MADNLVAAAIQAVSVAAFPGFQVSDQRSVLYHQSLLHKLSKFALVHVFYI